MKSLALTFFLTALLIGCQTESIEQFVQERALASNMNMSATSFRVQNVQTSDAGTVVLYSASDGLNPNYEHLGFVVLQKGLTGWKTGMMGSRGRDITVLAGETVDFTTVDISYETSMGLSPMFTHQLVYGEILAPQATAILAVSRDGSIIQNEGTSALFTFIVPKADYICELRILDEQKQVIEIITPASSEGRLPGPDCE